MEIPRKKDAATSTKQAGDAAEDRALAHLAAAGLKLLARLRTSTNTSVPALSRITRSISPPPRPGVR